jgi:hypothetical protein
MMEFLKREKAPASILGLTIDGSRLEAVVLRRTNGSLVSGPSVEAALALNPWTGDPQLVGREIRNRLDEAEIRERRCAVCIPLSWVLTLQTRLLPELPDSDIDSFLQIEAERGFPYPIETLLIALSRYQSPSGDRYVMQAAIPRDSVARLEQVLKAAKLKPVTFSLGLAALQNSAADSGESAMALSLDDSSVGLQISTGGGVALFRTVEEAYEVEGGEKRLQTAQIARELRITLGQLPADVRDSLRRLRIFGSGELARQLAEELEPRASALGIRLERVGSYAPDEFGATLPSGTSISPSLSLGARYLTQRSAEFEFLPPKINPWQQWGARYSSKTMRYAGAAVGSILLIVVLAFLIQQIRLLQLRSRWSAMSAKVTQLEDMQQQIRKYRPWFDESLRTLSILRRLTEAFPEDGSVSAKTVEFREPATVSCTGTARDSSALMKTLDQLRAAKEISSLKVDHLQGKSPLQFTFNFRWGMEGGNEH